MNLAAIDVAKAMHLCRPPERELLEAQMVGVTAKEMAQAARRYGDVHPAPLFQSPGGRHERPCRLVEVSGNRWDR